MTSNEQHDLAVLVQLLDHARGWEQHVNEQSVIWTVQPGSSLAGDDAKTAPYQTSHAVRNALSVAVDHLHCLRNSAREELQGHQHLNVRIHTHAQFSLVRGAFENAARAVWLLGPHNRLIRVERRLSLEMMEIRNGYRLHGLVNSTPLRTKDQREQQLRDLAVAAGTANVPATIKKALEPPRYSEIVRAAGDDTSLQADQAEFIWSACSSLAHGDRSGTLALLEKEIIAQNKHDASVRVTGSIGNLCWYVEGATVMIGQAFRLYETRAAVHV